VAGCRLRVGSPPAERSTAPVPEPSTDDQALIRALQQAGSLAAAYARAELVRPDLAAPLRQLAEDHAVHVRVLQALTAGSASSSASSSTSSSGSGTPSGAATGGTGPALTASTATSALSQSERAAASQAQSDLVTVGAQPARLLASLAACRSAHVALLARLPQTPRAAQTPAATKTSS
jgi:hypothetical protein